MCENVQDITVAMRSFVASLESATLAGRDAALLVENLAELGNLVTAARTLAAGRVVQTGAWRPSGATSAKTWLASTSGSTLAEAASTLLTAHALATLPGVRSSLASGRLSHVQAAEVAAAASADPEAEEALLRLAERESTEALRARCRDVIAAAAGDEDATERIRRGRYLRHRLDNDGSIRVDIRLAPDDAAPSMAVISARAQALLREARRSGRIESLEAYKADAFCELVAGSDGSDVKAVVNVHVSQSALERGRTVAGETCRIEGVGPISVTAAKRMAMRGEVKLLEIDGTDVRRVAHAGRTIPAALRSALETRDLTCVVPGCNNRLGLEIDHVVPVAAGGLTTLENLARLCRMHHAAKTHQGWVLGGTPGEWTWTRRRQALDASSMRSGP